MSSCISGGGRTYGFDLEIVKSPSTSSRTSHSSSPSSTISESINSPLALSTRKPRTPRKRPNQTYNEAAALLSTAYPNIFSTKNLKKPSKNTKLHAYFPEEFTQLLPPPTSPRFGNVEFLLQQPIPQTPCVRIEHKPTGENQCQSSPASDGEFQVNSYEEDFDAESILDEELEEGIDSIMGNLRVDNDANASQFDPFCWNSTSGLSNSGKFDFGFGTKGSVSALRHTDNNVDWWRFPTVDVLAISPRLKKAPSEKRKKKVERVEELKHSESSKETSTSKSKSDSNGLSLFLKLNCDEVLNAWSDRGSPFSEDISGTDSSESDVIARLSQIDLFPENGGVREASVLRYREKRRSRLFSKKIRYQVRKVNADRRPRMKGRFVRRPISTLRDEKK